MILFVLYSGIHVFTSVTELLMAKERTSFSKAIHARIPETIKMHRHHFGLWTSGIFTEYSPSEFGIEMIAAVCTFYSLFIQSLD